MNGWLIAESVVTAALIASLSLRTRVGARYALLCLALSGVLMSLCLGEWLTAGSNASTIALGVVAVTGFVIAWMHEFRKGRVDGLS